MVRNRVVCCNVKLVNELCAWAKTAVEQKRLSNVAEPCVSGVNMKLRLTSILEPRPV